MSGKPYPVTLQQEALRQTALAFYNKAIDVQYCAKALTIQERYCTRLCCGSAPEGASYDSTHYAVCSAYQYDIYKNAFDYELLASSGACGTPNMVALPVTDPIVVVKYGGEDGMTDLDAALKAARECLRVGDLLVGYRTAGHVMMYIGDYKGDGREYLIHCWGKSYIPETGEDIIECAGHFPTTHPKGGAIRIDEVDSYCFDPAEKKSYFAHACSTFAVLRPLNDPNFDFQPTAATLDRLKYRGIEIRREASLLRYNTAFPGERLTVTVTVTNNGDADYPPLKIVDPVPVGTVVEPTADEERIFENGCFIWHRAVPAGKAVSVSYCVHTAGKPGDRIVFLPGSVEHIPTRGWSMPVGGKPMTAEQLFRAEQVIRGGLAPIKSVQSAFVNDAYRQLFGMELKLPETLGEIIRALLKPISVFAVKQFDGKMLTPRTEDELDGLGRRLHEMLIPEHLLGHFVFTGDDPLSEPKHRIAKDRVRVYRERFYETGDIFLASVDMESFIPTASEKVLVYIYLGNGRVLSCDPQRGAVILPFEETVSYLLNKRIVVGLRPALAQSKGE